MRRSLVLAVVAALAACSSSKPSKPKARDEVVLDAVKAALDRHAAEHGGFPVATVDRTPADGCCAHYKTGGCNPTMFANLPWVDPAKLPPSFFIELTYDSDGKTATVHALANWDCDDTFTDLELSGTLADGGKTATWTTTRNATQD